MSCTPSSRPSGGYYVSLTLSIISLAVFTSLGMYVADTRSQLTTLSYTVSSHDARIAAIPDYVYEMDKDLNAIEPAAGETSPLPGTKKESSLPVHNDVILRTCVASSPEDKSTVSVSSALAHLVGREIYIPEIQYHVTVIHVEREAHFAPAVRICTDMKSSRLLNDKRVTVQVMK